MDGLILGVLLKFLWIKLEDMTSIASIAKQHDKHRHEPINSGYVMHYDVWLAQSSGTPALWSDYSAMPL